MSETQKNHMVITVVKTTGYTGMYLNDLLRFADEDKHLTFKDGLSLGEKFPGAEYKELFYDHEFVLPDSLKDLKIYD